MKIFFYTIIIAATLGLMVAAGGCKTNEANYRAAYEKAKEKATDTGDSTTTAQLRSSREPRNMVIDSVKLPIVTTYVRLLSEEKRRDSTLVLNRYCICAAQFRQQFNARSLASRLRESGRWPEATVVVSRSADNFVIAATTNSPAKAAALLDSLRADTATITLRAPYPYILRPSQFVR